MVLFYMTSFGNVRLRNSQPRFVLRHFLRCEAKGHTALLETQ
jgi:hypothetical protein